MNYYNKLKNEFSMLVTENIPSIPVECLSAVLQQLDIAASKYTVTENETSLAVVSHDVPDIVKIYLASKRVEGLTEGSIKNKFYRLRAFFDMVRKPIDCVCANDIRTFLWRMQESTGISNASLDGVRAIICSFFKWASEEGYIQKNPASTVAPVKFEKKQRVSLSQLELEYIRKACKTPRERAMIEFCYSTGCRVSEMSAVKISDIDFHSGTVHLFGKGRKHRTSYINAKAHVAINEYLTSRKNDCEYLFATQRAPYKQMTKAALEKVVRDIAGRVKDKISKPITPHIFRHTTATQAAANGMPVNEISQLLGHSNIATTMIYVDRASQETLRSDHLKTII